MQEDIVASKLETDLLLYKKIRIMSFQIFYLPSCYMPDAKFKLNSGKSHMKIESGREKYYVSDPTNVFSSQIHSRFP